MALTTDERERRDRERLAMLEAGAARRPGVTMQQASALAAARFRVELWDLIHGIEQETI